MTFADVSPVPEMTKVKFSLNTGGQRKTKPPWKQLIFECLIKISPAGFVKNTFAYSALFVCSNSSSGLWAIDGASIRSQAPVNDSLTKPICQALSPSSSAPPLPSSALVFLGDGWRKSLTDTNGHIQCKNASQIQLFWRRAAQITDQIRSRWWTRTNVRNITAVLISGWDQ